MDASVVDAVIEKITYNERCAKWFYDRPCQSLETGEQFVKQECRKQESCFKEFILFDEIVMSSEKSKDKDKDKV